MQFKQGRIRNNFSKNNIKDNSMQRNDNDTINAKLLCSDAASWFIISFSMFAIISFKNSFEDV